MKLEKLFVLGITILIIISFINAVCAIGNFVETHQSTEQINTALRKPALKVEPIESPSDFIIFEPVDTAVFETEITESETEMNNYTLLDGRYYHGITLTDDEIFRLAALVQAEADDIYECRLAIASIVINRMRFYEMGFYDTINSPGQFLTDWGTIAYAEPLDDSIRAVYDVLTYGTTIPVYVMFYRAECYHDWSDQTPYMNIGNSYFSYSQWQKELAEEKFN